jgi:hypothetical protein
MNLPQGINLQEIQRALLDLQAEIVRRTGSGATTLAGIPVLRRGSSGSPGSTSSPGSGSSIPPTEEDTQIIQTISIQMISMDPEDNLPDTDEDDCAIVGVQDVPILIEPMTPVNISVPSGGGTVIYALPSLMDETTTFINITGDHIQPVRIEVALEGKSVVFFNNSDGGANTDVVVALLGADPADAGVEIALGKLAWIEEKIDNTGLELVVYYA